MFGDLESHCEHFNVVMPSGVEIVGGCFLAKGDWTGARVIDQDPRDQFQERPADDIREQLERETRVKIQRRSLSVRRHASLPCGRLRFRTAIAPSMEGVFVPAAVSLGMMLVFSLALFVHHSPSGPAISDAAQRFLPLTAPLVAAAGSLIINQRDQVLRAKMLGPILFRVYSALVVGAVVVFLFTFMTDVPVQQPEGTLNGCLYVALKVASAWEAYALAYLVAARVRLGWARMRLDRSVGHTKELLVAK